MPQGACSVKMEWEQALNNDGTDVEQVLNGTGVPVQFVLQHSSPPPHFLSCSVLYLFLIAQRGLGLSYLHVACRVGKGYELTLYKLLIKHYFTSYGFITFTTLGAPLLDFMFLQNFFSVKDRPEERTETRQR